MILDIWTVMRKELREYLTKSGAGRRGRMSYLIYIVVFGVFFPMNGGVEGVETGISIFFLAWLPFLLVSSVIADAIAGERERKTLETLLSTPLSDQAILFGKMLAAILFGVAVTWICVIANIITVNVAFPGQGFINYPLPILAGVVIGGFLAAGLASGAGVLISLRSPTARQAAQIMSLSTIVIFLPFYMIPFLPEEWLNIGKTYLMSVDPITLVMMIAFGILFLNIFLFWLARKRFQRARLILS
ncbi:MAG: ABC transporter permease [Anaerolineaceae bacterium]|nr:ABC transporter permease [Anaerolineaceae bacterium]